MRIVLLLICLVGCSGNADLYFRPGLPLQTTANALSEMKFDNTYVEAKLANLEKNSMLFVRSDKKVIISEAYLCSIGPMTDFYLSLSTSSGKLLKKSKRPLESSSRYHISLEAKGDELTCSLIGYEIEILKVQDNSYHTGYSGLTTLPCCDISHTSAFSVKSGF